MSALNYTCPACGAPIAVENRFSKVVICQYCGQTAAITAAGLDPTGKVPLLADFPSIFSIGATGRLRGEPFRVLGRLRYKYDEGFWDEWFIAVGERKKIWMQEDEGTFVAFEKSVLTTPLALFKDIRVGTTITVNDRQVFVIEKNEAVIAGGEGEIHFKIVPGERVDYIDGNSEGSIVSIEVTPDEIHLSTGSPVDISDIVFDAND